MNRLHNHAQLTIDIGTEVRSQNNLLEDMVRCVAWMSLLNIYMLL